MIGAIVVDNIVQNTIIMNEDQIDEMSTVLGAKIVDARPYGLMIGDHYDPNDDTWTRNAGGDNLILTLLEPESYDSYTLSMERAEQAEDFAFTQTISIVNGTLEDENKPELMAIRASLDNLVVMIADSPADIYDNLAAVRDWVPSEYGQGDIRKYENKPYRCRQAHDSTGNDGWNPANTPSLWERIDREHAGTHDDPIPYDGNMELFEDKYYMQDGVLYRCIRSTGQPMYHPLSALLGLYVEAVNL